MGGTTCLICRCTWKNKHVSMFTVPKEESLRKLWNEACELVLRKNGRVCENHFRKDDFIKYERLPKKKRLKKNSVPSLFLKRANSPKHMNVKENDDIEYSYEENDDDEVNYNVERLDSEKDKDEDKDGAISAVSSNVELSELLMGNYSSKTNHPLEMRTCGLLKVCMQNKIYRISCFHCSEEFPLVRWAKFIQHLREAHQMEDENENSQESAPSTELDGRVIVEVVAANGEDHSDNSTQNIEDDSMDSQEEIEFFCDICCEPFTNEHHLQKHQSSDHVVANFPYECSRCDWRYTSEAKVQHHELEHKKGEQYFCEKCNKGFGLPAELDEHMAVHNVCPLCKKVLNSAHYYRKHMLLHYPPTHECALCCKKFHFLERLRDHVKDHCNQRDCICEECGKAFVRKRNLWQHKRKHHPS